MKALSSLWPVFARDEVGNNSVMFTFRKHRVPAFTLKNNEVNSSKQSIK